MVELKAYNGCIVQASDEAAPHLLAAGYVPVDKTALLEQPKAAPKHTRKPKE